MDYDFGSDFDLGSFEDIDLSGLGDIDLSGLEGMDLSSIDLGDLKDLDLDSIAELGIGDFNLSDDFGGGGTDFGTDAELQKYFDSQINDFGMDAPRSRSIGEGAGMDDSFRDEKGLDDLMMSLTGDGERDGEGEIPFGESASNYRQPSAEEREAERERYEKFLSGKDAGLELGAGTGKQDYGASTDVDKSLSDMGNRGAKLTSGWQKSSDGSYVNIRDDGTAIGIDQDGNSFTLSESQVSSRIKSGDLNSFKSGYNTATGGTKIAPGGGSPVTLKNGKEGQLMPDGRVIDKDTGKTIGSDKDVKTGKDSSGSGNKSGSENKSSDWMKWLMMLMALDAMRNKGGSSSAVIPSLSASRGTTRYADVQKAPGYRPGQGGVQYFGPTVYRAAGGGIGALDAAGGRLLRGPGDGVSDDIIAQIGDSQPARLADGEYVLDARTVSEIGNGSTDAGAEKIAQMVERIHDERRNAKRGEPSKADRKLLA
jgi:hypothetical protein